MTNILPYDKSEWLNQINNEHTNIDTSIDYFFTQRKVTENEQILDELTLERKNKRSIHVYNFLAINFPTTQFKNLLNLIIDVEIWGDEKFNFKGCIMKHDGEIPHLLLKLKEDKTIFVKLIFKENEKVLKTFISFIPVIKRYQVIPETIDM
jgi:hypothetical protein